MMEGGWVTLREKNSLRPLGVGLHAVCYVVAKEE